MNSRGKVKHERVLDWDEYRRVFVSHQRWQLTTLISAGPGCAADDVKHLELELQTHTHTRVHTTNAINTTITLLLVRKYRCNASEEEYLGRFIVSCVKALTTGWAGGQTHEVWLVAFINKMRFLEALVLGQTINEVMGVHLSHFLSNTECVHVSCYIHGLFY